MKDKFHNCGILINAFQIPLLQNFINCTFCKKKYYQIESCKSCYRDDVIGYH